MSGKPDLADTYAVFLEALPLLSDDADIYSKLSNHIKPVAKEFARVIKTNITTRYRQHVRRFVVPHFQVHLEEARGDKAATREVWRQVHTTPFSFFSMRRRIHRLWVSTHDTRIALLRYG